MSDIQENCQGPAEPCGLGPGRPGGQGVPGVHRPGPGLLLLPLQHDGVQAGRCGM